ncbi:MAG: DNA polymerase III subunit beta [Phycisphaerales bacterium]|jgi:DNA polymerase-3 subunit beta|nr:DNA polymerase III subunit beta [Phycisphaerales bacterium]
MTVKQATNLKAVCERDPLVEAMSLITGVVATRTPTPALQCVRISGQDGRLKLAATDAEVSLSLTLDRVDLQNEGDTLVPADKFSQIARSCNDATITIASDSESLLVRSSDSRFKVFGFPVSEAPETPTFENEEPDFTIDSNQFRGLMEKTVFAAASDHSRYAINGVLIDRTGNTLRLVATNGHRLALCVGTCDGDTENQQCIVPTKAMVLLRRLLQDDGVVSVKIDNGRVIFHVDGGANSTSTLSSNLVEGTFPPFEDVIPKDLDQKVTIGTDVLTRAVRRAHLMTNEESRGVRLVFDGDKLTITSRAPETGEAEVEVPTSGFSGEKLEIGFNPVYIIDALKVISEDEILMELKQSSKPGLIKSGNNFTYVVMPVNLQ